MYIELNRCTGGGVVTTVSARRLDWFVEVFRRKTGEDASRACLESAKRLRKLADKFEQLSREPDPFSEKTQARVNRG